MSKDLNQNENEEITMDDIMKEVDKSLTRINNGDILKGKILSISDKEVMVNIGYYADGIIPIDEVSYDDEIDISIGDEINVMVIKADDGEGNVLLSKKQADQIVIWDELQKIFDNEDIVEVTIKEVVKGGVIAYYKGVRAFIPGSHLSIEYIDDFNQFVGVKLNVKLIDYDVQKKKVIFSRKVVELKERQQRKYEIFKNIKKDKKYKGTVKRLTNFGAFVDIGGVDGLIHINDLSWTKIKHPSDVVNVGDQVEVYIIDFDTKKEKISLGLKDVNENPWLTVNEDFRINDVVEGKVVRLVSFGAFVQLKTGVEGLVHISEISNKKIAKTSEVLEEGQKVKVKILNINQKDQKLSLSIKEANELEAKVDIPNEFKNNDEGLATLGDLLKEQLKDLK